MLKPQNQGQHDRHAIIEAKKGRRLAGLSGKGQSGNKEVGIVVIANQALPMHNPKSVPRSHLLPIAAANIPRGEGLDDAAEFVSDSPLWREIRSNLIGTVHDGRCSTVRTTPVMGDQACK